MGSHICVVIIHHVFVQVEFVYVDDPVNMGPTTKEFFGLSSEGGEEPIKMDPAHIHFSRVGRALKPNHPYYCKLMHGYQPWHASLAWSIVVKVVMMLHLRKLLVLCKLCSTLHNLLPAKSARVHALMLHQMPLL